MKDVTKVIIFALSITIVVFIIIVNYTVPTANSTYTGDDFETKLIRATINGMNTKYAARSPLVTPQNYITCKPQSQYDYIMNGKISLLNDYGSRITYSFSAYIMNNSGNYYVVDSIIL